MNSGVHFQPGTYGLRAVVTSAWSVDIEREIASRQPAEIELNHAKGWRGKDVGFLAAFPNLQAIAILDFTIDSVEPIHALGRLKFLELGTYCETELHFACFPSLEVCRLEWRSGARKLFDCHQLRELSVNNYDKTDLAEFVSLRDLQTLRLLNAPLRTLSGIAALSGLRTLHLANLERLKSLDGIEACPNIEELDFSGSGSIVNIDALATLRNLKVLFFNDCGPITTLKPIAGLDQLEVVTFYGTTNILDGDLAPLFDKPRLRSTSFRNRRHYSYKREQFSAYGRRP